MGIRKRSDKPGKKAMKCPICGVSKTTVVNTYATREGLKRQRRCLGCNVSFHTVENIITEQMQLV